MKKAVSLVFVSAALMLAFSCGKVHPDQGPECLRELDAMLEAADEYVRVKEQRISSIENMLNSRGVSLLQQFDIYGQLFEEYEAFSFDKARDVLVKMEQTALELDDSYLLNEVLLDKAHLMTSGGFYLEADNVFDLLDTCLLDTRQKIKWYSARQKFLTDYQEYVLDAGIEVPDLDKADIYLNQILKSIPVDSYHRKHIEVISLVRKGSFEEALALNSELLSSLDGNSREFAIQAYWQGVICEGRNDMDAAMEWWAESAISDIKGAIKDNASLCTIAMRLEEDTDRAFRYIKVSLEDAKFFNGKLRKVQIASTLPWIENAYSESRMAQDKDRTSFILILSLVAFVLLLASVAAVRMYIAGKRGAREIEQKNLQLVDYNNSIAQAEEVLRKINLELVEANAAKEEYLGLFLSMCSGYIDKLKKTLTRDQYDAELRNFYKTFDTSFLSLYPTFVEQFNALLKEDQQIVLKEGELLNTELRIFALIKLGVNQSSHIASLLRYSVNTIYNYRAQVKNAVKEDRDNFEEMVRKIGSKR